MPSRREFVATVAATVGASVIRPAWTSAAGKAGIKTALNGPVGLQLWSVREYLPKDLPGTLAKVRAMGFVEVEGAGLWNHTVQDFRAALDAAGLRCGAAHIGFERLRDDAAGAFAEVKAMGASRVGCAWIPHKDAFTREDAARGAELFNRVGKAAREAGLGFYYHCHGYEFVPSADGTLFDTLLGATDAALVGIQVDVFHVLNGGGDPVAAIGKLKGRLTSLHVKDRKKGAEIKPGSGTAEHDLDVPVGTGAIDWPAVFRAAVAAGASAYYIEDESNDPLGHIPQSVAYLESLKL